MERMKTQVELLKECCDIKDAACVRYQKRIAELEEENKKLREENEELKDAMKELNNYNKFLIQENERQKSKTITVTDEDNRIILEKGDDGKWHSYGGGNVVLC